MKKLTILNKLLLLLIPLVLIQPVNAALQTDIYGTYADLGKEGSGKGTGITFLWGLPDSFNIENVLFYMNSAFIYDKKNSSIYADTVRKYIPVSAGFEYRYQIYQMPLYLTASAGAGVSYFEKKVPDYNSLLSSTSVSTKYSASGPYTDFMIGLNYVLTQRFAVFAKGGYQKSFYSEDNIESPSGFQFTTGLRFSLSETNRNFGGIEESYNDSEPAKYRYKPEKKPKYDNNINFTPGIIVPLGEFKEMAKPGYGGIINFTKRNFLFRRFEAGINTGFYYAPGKDLSEDQRPDYERFIIAPLFLNTGYRVRVLKHLYLAPEISFGYAYFNSAYKYFDSKTLEEIKKNKNFIDPIVKSGLGMEYLINQSFSVSVNGEYGMFIEKSDPMKFLVYAIGLNYLF